MKFWLEDPTVLFRNFQILPTIMMTQTERLNALTRLIIIITILLFLLKISYWFIFLFLGITIVIGLYHHSQQIQNEKGKKEEFYNCPSPRIKKISKRKIKFKRRKN